MRQVLLLVLAITSTIPALTLAPGAAASTAQQGEPVPPALPWWGPPELGEGWSLRVPVTVQGDLEGSVENVPVSVTIDFSEATQPTGWPATTVGGRSVLQSFQLDPDAVRVVEYTNFQLPRIRADDAKLVEADPSLSGADRYILPARVQRGSMDGAQAAPFDPSTNPVLTLQWIAPGALEPGEERTFVVYFDVRQNGENPPLDPARIASSGLGGLYWVGRGTVVFGVGDQVHVTAVNPKTEVVVYRYAGQRPEPLSSDAVTLAPLRERTFDVGTGHEPWMVRATGPVVASSHNPGAPANDRITGFYPSWDATLLGTQWALPVATSAVHVYNPGDDPARFTAGETSAVVLPKSAKTVAQAAESGFLTAESTSPLLIQGRQKTFSFFFTSPTGAPTGSSLYGSTEFFSETGSGGGFLRATTLGQQPVQVSLETLPDGEFVVPRPTAGSTGEPVTLPLWPTWAVHQAADETGPMILSIARQTGSGVAEVSAYGGPRGGSGSDLIASPIGGVEARNFSLPVTSHVFAFHNGTQVRPSGSGAGKLIVLDRYEHARIEVPDGESLKLHASRPVAVTPEQAIGYGVGLIEPSRATVGVAQYRGHLISLEPAGNETEPIARSVSFGQTATFDLVVRNLGRSTDGAPIPDRARLTLPVVPPGWNATISPREVDLPAGGSAPVTLEVTSPETRGSRDRALFPVRATSAGNPNMTDEVTTITLLQERRGVGLWFDREDGPTQLSLRFEPGTTRLVPVVVKNEGSARDTLRMSVANVEAGWSARFVDGNATSTNAVELTSGEARRLDLEVRSPPPGGLALPASLTLQATSSNDTTVTGKALLDALIASESKLKLSTPDPLLIARPGDQARFKLQLLNEGQTAADVQLNTTGALPLGWGEPDFLFRGQSIASVDNRLNSVSPTGEDGIPLELVIQVPTNATGGTTTRLLASAAPAGRGGGEPHLLPLNIHVEPFVDLRVPSGTLQRAVHGQPTNATIQVENRGDVEASLQVTLVELPEGWEVRIPDHLTVPARGNRSLTVEGVVPPGAPPGVYHVQVHLLDTDGDQATADVPFQVPDAPQLSVQAPPRVVAPPGVPTNLTLHVHNHGNAPAEIELQASAPEGWHVETRPNPVTVTPLSSMSVTVSIVPPRDALAPTTVSLAPADPGQEMPTTEVLVVPRRPALELLEVGLVDAAGRGNPSVRGILVNRANVTVHNLTVALLSGDEVLGKTFLERVPGNVSRLVVVTAGTGELPPTARLVVDPNGRFVEDERGDNTIDVTPEASASQTPLPIWLPLAASLVAVSILRWGRDVLARQWMNPGNSFNPD